MTPSACRAHATLNRQFTPVWVISLRISTQFCESRRNMNTITKLAGALLFGAGALGLAGCATGLSTQVSRYQAMPAPAGQTFFVVPMDARLNGSLEFQRFGAYVSQAMAAQGYAPAASPQAASLIVNVG